MIFLSYVVMVRKSGSLGFISKLTTYISSGLLAHYDTIAFMGRCVDQRKSGS